MMATEDEHRKAIESGARFRAALLGIGYNAKADSVVFRTPWGERSAARVDVPYLRDVPPSQMANAYVSHAGIHIDELDLDINAAGLLAVLFPDLADDLTNSY